MDSSPSLYMVEKILDEKDYYNSGKLNYNIVNNVLLNINFSHMYVFLVHKDKRKNIFLSFFVCI